eukprot:gene12008-8270_t
MVKQRMTALDVRASVEEMRTKLVGLRLLNLYDLNAKMFLFRFGHGENKKAVLLENGVRFHLTELVREKPKVPSQFTLKLRKHIRSWRLDTITQLQNDRSIDMCFGATGTSSCFHIIIELFSKGNVVLTDHAYSIMMLLRTHRDDDVKIAVRETYPVGQVLQDGMVLHEWVEDEKTGALEMREIVSPPDDSLAQQERAQRRAILLEQWLTTFHRNGPDESIKSTLSGVRHFGPAIAEHILTRCGVSPNTKKKDVTQTPEELFEVMLPEMMAAWDIPHVKLRAGGYLLKHKVKRGKGKNKGDAEDQPQPQPQERGGDGASAAAALQDDSGVRVATVVPTTIQYDDFSPLLLAQCRDPAVTEVTYLPVFGAVCDAFFLPTEADKIEQHNDKKKTTALSKREKFERDHLRRITALEQQQEINVRKGELIISNAERVDEALALINGALATGIQWSALKALLRRRHEEGHPVAYIIHDLFLERNAISVLLERELYDDEDDQDVVPEVVEVSLAKSAHANAADYFAKKKANKAKLEKTLAATEKAAAGAARKGDRQAAKQKTKKQLVLERKRGWWEKFNWFRTSTGDVALQGKDYQTTEILVRRVMRLGDLFVHSDIAGALPCLLRPMGEVWEATGGTTVLARSLCEVGGWCVSRSASWQSKQTTSAWWIYGSQLTGGTATGTYLYDGERHFIPPQPLSLGVALLFTVARDMRDGEDNPGVDAHPAAGWTTAPSEGSHDAAGEVSDVPPDPAAALHALPTAEELRAEQRKNVATGGRGGTPSGGRGAGRGRGGGAAAPTAPKEHVDPTATKRQQVLQGNLTKQQARKLQKIKRKYADQDEEDRRLGAMLNGNQGALVQELLSAPSERSETLTAATEEEEVVAEATQEEAAAPLSNTGGTVHARSAARESSEEVARAMDDELRSALLHYTRHPRLDDTVYHAVAVCAPYAMLMSYPLRAELIVGSSKKGEAATNMIAHFSKQVQKNPSLPQEALLDLLQKMEPTDIIEQLRSDIKPLPLTRNEQPERKHIISRSAGNTIRENGCSYIIEWTVRAFAMLSMSIVRDPFCTHYSTDEKNILTNNNNNKKPVLYPPCLDRSTPLLLYTASMRCGCSYIIEWTVRAFAMLSMSIVRDPFCTHYSTDEKNILTKNNNNKKPVLYPPCLDRSTPLLLYTASMRCGKPRAGEVHDRLVYSYRMAFGGAPSDKFWRFLLIRGPSRGRSGVCRNVSLPCLYQRSGSEIFSFMLYKKESTSKILVEVVDLGNYLCFWTYIYIYIYIYFTISRFFERTFTDFAVIFVLYTHRFWRLILLRFQAMPNASVDKATVVSGLCSPVFRGPLNHGSIAELQEGFRVLTMGKKNSVVTPKALLDVMGMVGVHTSEEELQELLRVVHQDDRTSDLEFAEFVMLMTKEVDKDMEEEMLSAFREYDKGNTGKVSKKQFSEMFLFHGEKSSPEELEELMTIAEANEESDVIDYQQFVRELKMTLNNM